MSDNVCDQLMDLWDEVSRNWSAEAAGKYYRTLYSEILECAREVYSNNADLQSMALRCSDICNGEDY